MGDEEKRKHNTLKEKFDEEKLEHDTLQKKWDAEKLRLEKDIEERKKTIYSLMSQFNELNTQQDTLQKEWDAEKLILNKELEDLNKELEEQKETIHSQEKDIFKVVCPKCEKMCMVAQKLTDLTALHQPNGYQKAYRCDGGCFAKNPTWPVAHCITCQYDCCANCKK